MFKKFRRNILLMNVTLITILLIASFVSIYLLTRRNVFDEINIEFRRASSRWSDVRKDIEDSGQDFNIDTFNNYLKIIENYKYVQSRIVNTYMVYIDTEKAITKEVGFYDIDYRVFSDIINEVDWTLDDVQYLHHKDINWAYRIRNSDQGNFIIFMNITGRLGVLKNLIVTSLLIFVITMVFVVFISAYMTNKSIKPLDEAYRMQRQFISDASHELRTPLASINANADLVMSKNYIRPAEMKWLDYIKKETGRMSNLTYDLLYLAEIDEQSYDDMDIKDINLSMIAETYTLGLEARTYEKKLKLISDIEKDIIIKGEEGRISQVFIILLENAINYTPEGGHIELSLKKTRSIAELIVSNTGSYIPEDIAARVFDRFYRMDQSRSGQAESHGLGLAIAKSIVERHKGTISCRSSSEGLTSFIVKFNIS